MADKLLKSIKFPTLPDRYVIGDSTLTEEGAAAEAKAVGEALATKADTKGRYEDLIVGGAEQLMADGYETDKEPYLFRTTGGSADVGNREYLDKIVGGTVAWNQLVPTLDTFRAEDGVTMTYADGVATISSTTARNGIYAPLRYQKGNKYLFMCDLKATSAYSVIIGATSAAYVSKTVAGDNQWHTIVGIDNSSASFKANAYIFATAPYENLQVRNYNIFDLTAMFGTTIADYIYSLEQSQAGAGVAWFRQYFPKDYYPYDKGTLRSVEGVSAHETVGFNQWDGTSNIGYYWSDSGVLTPLVNNSCTGKIPVIQSRDYYFINKVTNSTVKFYDNSMTLLTKRDISSSTIIEPPSGCAYLCVNYSSATGVPPSTCINISDPSRNGEYEPYTKHTYPLDSSLTLRGVPKLVDGKLAFDGDVYPPSGEVQRRYGLRAYQSGDESLADAITDGANTVYKLSTPTTETADGYEQYQICDTSGTEEFVTTGIVPVGHETRYPHDLKKKIETAPDSPSTDGTYLMKRSGGKNTYMALPSTPSANGAYVLTVTVSGGSASYSWTSKE